MTDPIRVNLAAIEQRAAQKESRQLDAKQDAAKARFTEDVERGFNPDAVEREQSRREKFRTLETRKKQTEAVEQKITEVEARSEEDLAQNYNRRNPELPADRLRDLKNALRQNQTAEEVLKDVSDAFEDATLADEALEYLEKQTQGDLKQNVRKARELFKRTKRPRNYCGSKCRYCCQSLQ